MSGDGKYSDLTYKIIGCAQRVHSELGPGFPESVYHRAMLYEIASANIQFETEHTVAVEYMGNPCGDFRLDLIISNKIVVELKALASLTDVHMAQVLSYLKATRLSVGLLFNFGTESLQTKRIAL
jgi:GxxExxY protein